MKKFALFILLLGLSLAAFLYLRSNKDLPQIHFPQILAPKYISPISIEALRKLKIALGVIITTTMFLLGLLGTMGLIYLLNINPLVAAFTGPLIIVAGLVIHSQATS
jgi:hypothetical protein